MLERLEFSVLSEAAGDYVTTVLTRVEVVQLINLAPPDARAAKALIPTLRRLEDAHVEEALGAVRAYHAMRVR